MVAANFSRVLVTHDNLNQKVNMKMTMVDDNVLTPVSYEYSSRITDNALCDRPELNLDRRGYIEDSDIIERIRGKEYKRSFDGKLVFDSSVYDMSIRSFETNDFTYYENLYAMKTGNRLDKSDRKYSVEGIVLDMMIHRGNALTERRFYRNKNRVPVIMIQNSVAYILEPRAKERIDKLKSELNSGGYHYEY
jgi:hypothetical protein